VRSTWVPVAMQKQGAAVEVELSPDQRAFVHQAIASGRLHNEQEAVRQALVVGEERELSSEVKSRRRQRLAATSIARIEWRTVSLGRRKPTWTTSGTSSRQAVRALDRVPAHRPSSGDDLLPELRSFPAGRDVVLYSVEPNENVLILRVIPGDRDIPGSCVN
jgi:Arc/MetJ-type ribon-helix-helix transcriptional regulator